ncbi:hypothetical protein BDN71DRAFT_1594760 [Pleurotus eryngii]|uniref:Uncharacterized protein n=1 Tax=Pleurotus eryngii TaxID=5323 RepID=A0A9P5ZGT2_PLEER|nr:hypothetical protein BDN71DRAFT_1594760 [Pleurotus eryngii]
MANSLTPKVLIEFPSKLTNFKHWEFHKRTSSLAEKLVQMTDSPIYSAYQAWDGLVGAVIPTHRQFITSPNASEIFTLPELNASVVLREDGRWGPDDPFQCPQLYQPQYCHYACILKRIEDLNDPRSIMWWTPTEGELRPDAIIPGRYSVNDIQLTPFQFCVHMLINEFFKGKDSLRTQANSQWVNTLINQLQTSFNRLSTFTTTFPNILFLVAEVQRRWLDLRAYIGYMVFVKGELSKLRISGCKFPSCRSFIGAITHNLTVAEEFASTGVPVWLVRDLSEFSTNIHIQSLVALQQTVKLVIVEPFPGMSRAVYIGPSDTCAKYNSIYKYSCQHFSFEDEIERPPQPPVVADDASAHECPAKRLKTRATAPRSKARTLPALNDKDITKFHPSDHPFWPPILPAWRDALAAVNHSNSRVVAEWVPGDSGYRFPNPHLFVLPILNNVNKHLSSYYLTWLNYEDAIWLAQSSPKSTGYTTTQWRELLLLSMKDAGVLSFKVNSGAEGRMSEMMALLQQWVTKHNIKIAIPDAGSAKVHGYTLTLDLLPPADVAQMIVYVLCELNFRSELRVLDTYMHTSSSSRCSAVSRDTLLGYCFPGWLPGMAEGDVLSVSEADGLTRLCAPTLEERSKYILALAQVMSSWRNAPLIIRTRVPGQSVSFISFVDANLEGACTQFYSQSFFDRFARVPTVPCYLCSRLPYNQ